MTTTPLSPVEQVAADALRALGQGDRKIAKALGVTHWAIRKDRQHRLTSAHSGDPLAVVVNDFMVAFYV